MAHGGDGSLESAGLSTPLGAGVPSVMDDAHQPDGHANGHTNGHANGAVNGHTNGAVKTQPVETPAVDPHLKLRKAAASIESLRNRFLNEKEEMPAYRELQAPYQESEHGHREPKRVTRHSPFREISKNIHAVRSELIKTNLTIEALEQLYALLPDELEGKAKTFEAICLALSNEGNDIVDQSDYLRGEFARISSDALAKIDSLITGKPVRTHSKDADRVNSVVDSLSGLNYVVDPKKIFGGVSSKNDLTESFKACKTKMHVEGNDRQEIGALILDAIRDKKLKPSELRLIGVLDWFLQSTDASTYFQPSLNGSIGRLIESLKEGKRATMMDIMKLIDFAIPYRAKQCQDLVGTAADNVTQYLRYRPEYGAEPLPAEYTRNKPEYKSIPVHDKDVQSKIKQPSGIEAAEKNLREYFDVPHPSHSTVKPPKHKTLKPNYWHEMKCNLMIQMAEDCGREKKLDVVGAEEGAKDIIQYAREHGYAANPLIVGDMMNNPNQGYQAVQGFIDQDNQHIKKSAKKKSPEILEMFNPSDSDTVVEQRKRIVSGSGSTMELGRQPDVLLNERACKPDATVMATFVDAIRHPDEDRITAEAKSSLKGDGGGLLWLDSNNYAPLRPRSMKDYVDINAPRTVPQHLYAGLAEVLGETAAPLLAIYAQISSIKDPAEMAIKDAPQEKLGFLRS